MLSSFPEPTPPPPGVAHVTPIWTAFLILTSVVLAVNFQTVGGLMIYSLLTNPAVAAFLLVKGYGRTLALSGLFGVLSGLGGFLLAAATDTSYRGSDCDSLVPSRRRRLGGFCIPCAERADDRPGWASLPRHGAAPRTTRETHLR